MRKVAIVTLSDKGFKGEREDISKKVIEEIITLNDFILEKYILIPDDIETIKNTLISLSDEDKIPLILTTGGTGFSKRDNTPEATKEILEKEIPGISEAMRSHSLTITKRAMLSRGVSGIRNNSLIINLPGSPKAAKENLEYIIGELKHGLDILLGDATDCAEEIK